MNIKYNFYFAALAISTISTIGVFSAYASPFKCIVDGKTTYQDAPCEADVKARGGESKVAAPPAANNRFADGITTIDKKENTRRDALVKSNLEPLARETFAAVKAGQLQLYREKLCPKMRQTLIRPDVVAGFRQESADYTKRNTELVKVTSANSDAVTFSATEANDAKLVSGKETLSVCVYFQWDNDTPCVTHMSSWRTTISK